MVPGPERWRADDWQAGDVGVGSEEGGKRGTREWGDGGRERVRGKPGGEGGRGEGERASARSEDGGATRLRRLQSADVAVELEAP